VSLMVFCCVALVFVLWSMDYNMLGFIAFWLIVAAGVSTAWDFREPIKKWLSFQ